jgi:sulfite reductase alpha subunit-like flavoprotein
VNRVINFNKENWISKSTPLIMIANGTGVVPFISIIERLHSLRDQIVKESQPGPVYLFYGGRNNNEEFFYRDRII